jgi:hypothetical protein
VIPFKTSQAGWEWASMNSNASDLSFITVAGRRITWLADYDSREDGRIVNALSNDVYGLHEVSA